MITIDGKKYKDWEDYYKQNEPPPTPMLSEEEYLKTPLSKHCPYRFYVIYKESELKAYTEYRNKPLAN